MSKEAVVHVSLTIEQDDTVPVPLVQVAFDTTHEPDGADHVVVVATNWAESNTGAAAVAAFLRTAADAIDAELGFERAKAQPARTRFNPRPAGAR